MVDEQEPTKRVVKRVVKKTVVRPAAPAPQATQVRYGRPVPTAQKPQAKAETKQASKSGGVKLAPTPKPRIASRPKIRPTRPTVDVGAKIGAAGHAVGDAWWSTRDAVGSGARRSGSFIADQARVVASWRLPHINPYLAAVISGAVVGLVSVGLGFVALAIFSSVRGVSSGGGLWGGLTFIGVAVVGYFLGRALMAGFGSRAPGLTSFLGIILTIVAILGLFLDLASSGFSIVVVPLLGVAAFCAAHWLADLAENSPTPVE